MEEVIEQLRELNEPVPVPLELPDDDLLVEIEEQLLINLPFGLREFLLQVSDVIYGRRNRSPLPTRSRIPICRKSPPTPGTPACRAISSRSARMDATITWSIWMGRSPCGMATMAS